MLNQEYILQGGIFMDIGAKIKSLRTINGLTQEELADRCELTKGFISQLENNNNEPSISTLQDILTALGTNLKEFFSDEEDEQVVFKKEDYFSTEYGDYTITWLVPNSQKNEMEPICVELKPQCVLTKDMPHEGQEFGYVLKGKIIVVIGNKSYKVKQNESFYYDANKVHYIKNDSNEIAKIIWVSCPPTF